jgi:S-adenosylmethionine:tRNA ribosyltransferase-isomerase
MIYNRKKDLIELDTFTNLLQYLPQDCVLVLNQTKVIPAKFTLKKETGGTVGALFLEEKSEQIIVLASGKLHKGDTLFWGDHCSFEVMERNEKEAYLKPSIPLTDFKKLLEEFGETPLPPYMKDSPLTEERRRAEYQTVYAEDKGSVAAPTAGLHLTKELIKKIEQSGKVVAYVTLHVNLGTFAELTEEKWKAKKLHHESYSIDQKTADMLNEAKKDGKTIIAVGTTTVRTLESAQENGELKKLQGSTDLFLTEHSQIHFTDALITNFHVPKSSLLMLVSAFTGREKLLKLYNKAINERMRFFSFGDGMLIL